MSMSSSLNAGVMGLNVNATRLATISDNVANASTYGFKRTEANFSSLVLQQRRNAFAAGGVRVDTTTLVTERGSLVSTGSSTDIAVAGRGLLPVTTAGGLNEGGDARNLLLTPTGDFAPDQDGFLRSAGGLYLLGWPTDAAGDVGGVSRRTGTDLVPVNINVGQFSAEPTTRMELGVNLPARDTEAGGTGDPYVLPLEYFDNLGKLQQATATFTPSVPGAGASNSWTVTITDDAIQPPATVATLDVTFDDTNTAGGTIASVNAGGGATYDAATGLVSLTLSSGPVEIGIGRPGDADGLTQLSASFSPYSVTKNGAPVGDLPASRSTASATCRPSTTRASAARSTACRSATCRTSTACRRRAARRSRSARSRATSICGTRATGRSARRSATPSWRARPTSAPR